MYNTKFVCTYNTSDVFSVDDIITDTDKEFIRNVLYRQELLNILGMEEFNDIEMGTAIHELYKKISENTFIKDTISKRSVIEFKYPSRTSTPSFCATFAFGPMGSMPQTLLPAGASDDTACTISPNPAPMSNQDIAWFFDQTSLNISANTWR